VTYADLKEGERTTIRPGVLYCLRHLEKSEDELLDRSGTQDLNHLNRLHPYYLVYIYNDGAVRYGYSQPRQVLEVMRLLCQGQEEADMELCSIFNKETDEGQKVDPYFQLLRHGVKATTTQAASANRRQLQAGRGQAVAKPTSTLPANLTDFELITWLVVK
jgi:hypothetical protein